MSSNTKWKKYTHGSKKSKKNGKTVSPTFLNNLPQREKTSDAELVRASPTVIEPLSPHSDLYRIWTDGSHRPPDNAGCAYLIFSDRTKHLVTLQGEAYRGETINRMELKAIDLALDYPNLRHVLIYTDSMYCISALTLWITSWKRNNWMSPMGESIKNRDLIESISTKMEKLESVGFVKVKAHTGDLFNSVVDYLAQAVTKHMVSNPQINTGSFCL